MRINNHDYTVEDIKDLIKAGHKITGSELMTMACDINDAKQPHKTIVIKINEDTYKKWYENDSDKRFSLADECTYVTSTDQKAFQSEKIGYSIFARSLADYKRLEEGAFLTSIDRIERMPIEWAVVLD